MPEVPAAEKEAYEAQVDDNLREILGGEHAKGSEEANEVMEAPERSETSTHPEAEGRGDEYRPEEEEAEPESEPQGEVRDPGRELGPDLGPARAALQRDGYTPDQVEKLLKAFSAEELLELGTRRAKNQADVDGAYGDLNRLRAAKEPAKGQEEPGTPTVPGPGDTSALREAARPIAEALGLGGEESETLATGLQGFVDAYVSPVLGDLRQRLAEVQEATADTMLTAARNELSKERIPTLREDSVFGRVKSEMTRLAASGRHGDLVGDARVKALMLDAARLEFPEDVVSDAEAARRNRISTAKKNGSPKRTSQRGDSKSNGKPRTPYDQELIDKKIDAATRGASAEDLVKIEKNYLSSLS